MNDCFPSSLFESLKNQSQNRLALAMTHVALPFRTYLYKAGEEPASVTFLASGIASVVGITAEGTSAEVALIGKEGLIGALHLFGPSTDSAECFRQSDGAGWQISIQSMVQFLEELPDLRRRVLEYLQCYAFNMTQIATCNHLHDVDRRLARWLIMAQSRLGSSDLPFTHEILGVLIGASRPTVSKLVRQLQMRGLIEVSRRHVLIRRPEVLRELACDCLESIETRVANLYL